VLVGLGEVHGSSIEWRSVSLATIAPLQRLAGQAAAIRGGTAGIPPVHAVFLDHRSYESGFGTQLVLVWIFVLALNLAWVGWRRNPPDKPE
jgi:hypothetical protein